MPFCWKLGSQSHGWPKADEGWVSVEWVCNKTQTKKRLTAYMEYHGDPVSHSERSYYCEVGTKFDDCGTKFAGGGTK